MTYLEHAGHLSLSDGSVLRLDFECHHWCASYYQPGPQHLLLRAYAYGGFEAMRDMVATWFDAHTASLASPLAGVGNGSGRVPMPCPEPPNLLGNTTFKETA